MIVAIGRRSSRVTHVSWRRPASRGHLGRDYWEQRGERIAPEVGAYIRAALDSKAELNTLREVKATLAYLEKFPVERAVAACARAQHFGNYRYVAIRNILRDGLDLSPVSVSAIPTCGAIAAPRFARSINELIDRTEVNRERN